MSAPRNDDEKNTKPKQESSKNPNAPSTGANFRAAMQGVTPLAESKRVTTPLTTKRPITPSPAKHAAQQTAFEVHRDGEAHWGHRADLAPKILQRLRRGEIAIERELDLHHLTEEEARIRVLEFLRAARNDALRCVRIIHGRGLHSGGGPILKAGFVNWLEADPAFAQLKAVTLAFATAPPKLGGSGATLILFARQR